MSPEQLLHLPQLLFCEGYNNDDGLLHHTYLKCKQLILVRLSDARSPCIACI